MKKIILLIAVFAIGTASAFAQKFNMKDKISYEIRAGVNFSQLSISCDIPNNKIQQTESLSPGINIGVLVNLPFLENIDFQTGLFGSIKDGFYELEYPFFISYHQDIKPQLKWNLYAGPHLDLLYDFPVSYDDVLNDVLNTDDDYYFGDYQPFELGFSVGTGFYYKKMYLGIQYDMGLRNITSSDYELDGYRYYDNQNHQWKYIPVTTKLSSFSVNIGYKF
ncbi:MAG: hypothetical protein EZS26_000522 [Candidatus Ordinivivax streblomastigis]|uniref:Outer membrane protein beta-barrel domain-containing protein n=1 Tax=Candidatus Ordinivivax streblomastigis TaxID=2540710 RepID=A0A5M8P462_9BACT|nr:MAG: hypothetical protein EZS26_000445 [Candidatus Ordinivivax streblomastigis]KAA6303362.1 MAG: hypothetical protein EZS26_000522 [Candidatus Ordinivivax streblomastigis]